MGRWSHSVIEIPYSEQSTSVRKAYRENVLLVLQPGSSLPDICVACGRQASGNLIHRKFSEDRFTNPWWWLVPPTFDLVLTSIFARCYVFDFPFCRNHTPSALNLTPTRLDRRLAIFIGAPQELLDVLPRLPRDVADKNRTWLQRNCKWLYP